MSLVTLALYISGTIAALGALISFLPDGSYYPYPDEITLGFVYLKLIVNTFDLVLPVSEFFQILEYGIYIFFVSRIIWPSAMWVFKAMTRTS